MEEWGVTGGTQGFGSYPYSEFPISSHPKITEPTPDSCKGRFLYDNSRKINH